MPSGLKIAGAPARKSSNTHCIRIRTTNQFNTPRCLPRARVRSAAPTCITIGREDHQIRGIPIPRLAETAELRGSSGHPIRTYQTWGYAAETETPSPGCPSGLTSRPGYEEYECYAGEGGGQASDPFIPCTYRIYVGVKNRRNRNETQKPPTNGFPFGRRGSHQN
jgi:hypothetical protein